MQITVRDPGSALTHFAGFVCAILATPFLLIHAVTDSSNVLKLSGLSIYMISMILLYGASSAYHSFNISEKANKILKKLDHN